MFIKRMLVMTGLAIGASGCTSTPDPVLYTLGSPSSAPAANSSKQVIGLSELSLPAYARNLQITTALSAYRVSEDDDHRWASPPSEALTAALSKALESSTGSTVLQRPYPSGVRPDIRLTITFDRLLRGEKGDAEMSGQYLIQTQDETTEIKRFSIIVPSDGSSYEAYMAALSTGLIELGSEIATHIEPDA